MEVSKIIHEELETSGFVEVDEVLSIEHALKLTSQLGPVRSLNGNSIQTLRPTREEEATSPSFSRTHGYGTFPLHTDTSFWEVPARYIVWYMAKASGTSTMVLPSPQTRELLLRYKKSNPIFVRKTISGASYSPPWFGPGSEFIVYDPCYMKPANNAAVEFDDATGICFENSTNINWQGSKMLIVDNWCTFHGRQKADDGNRVLHRFYRGNA